MFDDMGRDDEIEAVVRNSAEGLRVDWGARRHFDGLEVTLDRSRVPNVAIEHAHVPRHRKGTIARAHFYALAGKKSLCDGTTLEVNRLRKGGFKFTHRGGEIKEK